MSSFYPFIQSLFLNRLSGHSLRPLAHSPLWQQQSMILGVMLLLVALTRYNHFFTQTLVADATWAVFFMAGLVLSSMLAPVVLLAEVVMIDLGWQVFSEVGATEGCLSLGYPFLLVAYMSLWVAGRWVKQQASWSLRGLAMTYMGLAVGVLTAFIISNLSWYAFSTQLQPTTMADFAVSVSPYLLSFFQAAVFWVSLALLAGWIISSVAAQKSSQVVVS